MRTLYTQLEKHDEEMEIMKIKHSDHITTVVEKCAQNMEVMRTDMQSHHEKERTSMQNYLLVMREKHAKEMDDHKSI